MASREWELEDTFRTWREKYNNLASDPVITAFEHSYDEEQDGLTFPVTEGRVRIENESVAVTANDIVMDADDVAYVVLYMDPTVVEIRSYTSQSDYPNCGKVIPLFYIESGTDTITLITDLRTWAVSASSTNQADSILQFDKNVCFDITIPDDKNAISVDPEIDDGVTVTVSEGSTWVIL